MTRRQKRNLDPAVDAPEPSERPSKTALKAEAHRRQTLGEELARLPASRRRLIPISEELEEAIKLYLGLNANEAKRRQRQFIGRLLRDTEIAPIERAIDDFKAGRAANADKLHTMESWRDRMIASDQAVTDWMEKFPDCDAQHLRSLVRQARKAADLNDPEARKSRSYRELFKLIRESLENAQEV